MIVWLNNLHFDLKCCIFVLEKEHMLFHQEFRRLHNDVQPHHEATTKALDFHVHSSSSTRLLVKGSSINGTRQFHQWNSLVPSMELISSANGTHRFV